MCACSCLGEDNARFILLFVLLAAYTFAGAALFQHFEADLETRQAAEFWKVYHAFRKQYLNWNNHTVLQRLDELLYAYGNASSAGIINKSRRWDFPGSLHFVFTIVTTIGYGNTAPQSASGKIAVIFYGFVGCSGGILFFNLFLERIITFLAWVLRLYHQYRLRKQSKSEPGRKYSLRTLRTLEDDSDLDQWKPSVYWVMFYLLIFAFVVAGCAATVYVPLEDWGYLDAIYFCFVSFATIGFGDFVTTEKAHYSYAYWYRLLNFLFILVGCCCTYSLLNVTSIVIKQGLNCITQKLRCGNRDSIALHIPRRRSSVSTMYFSKRRGTRVAGRDSKGDIGTDMPRRMSGEIISMQDLFSANNVSLAAMQKQLQEMAQLRKGVSSTGTAIRPDAVGPLAIVSEKFQSKINRKR
ncbi:potassium channel subfamily K member 13-like isoform X2 [Lasioglossum baleicum]|uniref:potassium channel subfamily K member 13-like isoform X2 n=1 Tax=Lasioglossum baleicum TaxID=434251 RepID=UPI003FCD8063